MEQTHPGYVKIRPFPNNSDNLKFLLATEAYVSLLDVLLGGWFLTQLPPQACILGV